MKITITILLNLIPFFLLSQTPSIKLKQNKKESLELIVMIECANYDDIYASGIVIGRTQSELLIVSAQHNFESVDSSTLLNFFFKNIGNGVSLKGNLIRRIGDTENEDLALLKVKIPKENQYLFCDLKFNQLVEKSTLKKGDKINTVGYGNLIKWNEGKRTDDVLTSIVEKFVLFNSVDIIDGFSGGGLLNANGHLIGMILEDNPPKAYRLDRILDTVTSLGYEIDLDYALPNGMNRLHDAVQKGNILLLENYLEDCPDLNSPDNAGATALHYATEFNTDSALPILLNAGFDPKIKDRKGEFPIHWAIENENLKAVKKFFELNTAFYLDSSNNYSLMQKALDVDRKIADYLKGKGISLEFPKNKDTMLINAVYKMNFERVLNLLNYGANPDQKAPYYSPSYSGLVSLALSSNAPLIAEALIEYGADLTIDAYSIISWAIRNENGYIIQAWLKDERNDPFITHTTGASGTSSPIFYQVYLSHYITKIAEIFASKGYDINYQEKYNQDTLAHTIIKNWDQSYVLNNKKSAEELLEHVIGLGADLNIKNKKGKTPLDYIKSERQNKQIQYLIKISKDEKK